MKDKVFINRKKDLNEFKTLLNITEDNKNSIIILHANSGFGKSSFTNKLLEDTKDYIAIKISLPSSSYSKSDGSSYSSRLRSHRPVPGCTRTAVSDSHDPA